jgi:hypothetical protein
MAAPLRRDELRLKAKSREGCTEDVLERFSGDSAGHHLLEGNRGRCTLHPLVLKCRLPPSQTSG